MNDSGQGGSVTSPVGDECIAERVSRKIRQGETSLGILSEDPIATSYWQIGKLARTRWVVSAADLPARSAADPPWFKSWDEVPDGAVSVVVVQGSPTVPAGVWKDPATRVVIQVRSRDATSLRAGTSWSTLPEWCVQHSMVGGVTDGEFVILCFTREGNEVPFSMPRTTKGSLGEALKATEPGKPTRVPKPGERNTYKGVLDYEKRFGEVVAPSVFSKSEAAVRRKLGAQELLRVMDVPENRTRGMTDEDQQFLKLSLIPGKVSYASTQFLSHWNPAESSKGEEASAPKLAKVYVDHPEVTSEKDAPPLSARLTTECERHSVPIEESSDVQLFMTDEEDFQHWQDEVLRIEVDRNEGGPTAKAVKDDDAKVPVHLWNDRIASKLTAHQARSRSLGGPPPKAWDYSKPEEREVLDKLGETLRRGLLHYWHRKLRTEFDVWFRESATSELIGERKSRAVLKAGIAALRTASKASWWDWDAGSAIFFWRWPKDYQDTAREGLAPMFDGPPPQGMMGQPPYKDTKVRNQVKAKLQRVLDRGYIKIVDIEEIESLMYMFHVPKGETDIRMVYDGTKSGLNESLFAPWFALPRVDTMARWVVAGSWLADNDYGDMFLNFPLHPNLQKFCGVDLSQLFPEMTQDQTQKYVGVWLRNAMGLSPSPYASVQGALRAKGYITGRLMGDRHASSNAYQWDHVLENLPFTQAYKASLPRIRKVRRDGGLASEVVQYVDDLRIVAHSEEQAWLASSQIAKGLAWLGLQDAARKKRRASQRPGAWAGSVISSDTAQVTKSVTQERWEKIRRKIRWLGREAGLSDKFSLVDPEKVEVDTTAARDGTIHFKTTERLVGFVVYAAQTFTVFVPYLKGIYLTLNSWRKGRDREGWMTPEGLRAARMGHKESDGEHPEWVRMVPRFKLDLEALMRLTAYVEPPDIPIRASHDQAIYIVGDASGEGFGSCVWRQGDPVIDAEFGRWTPAVTEEKSSNFREAANLVIRLRRLINADEIPRGTEVFICTDNAVAESTYFKGSSKSSPLHNLIVELKRLEMEGWLIIHFIWIPGTRMIEHGTDGLSRGDTSSGVMGGKEFLSLLPLNESALDRQLNVKRTVLSWTGHPLEWTFAVTEDWFGSVFDDPNGSWIWSPPPCLARVAIDQLCEVKHMYPASKHIFLCPALMTGYWRKSLGKIADAMVTLRPGSVIWKKEMLEPLTIAFVCPLLHRSPWRVRRMGFVDEWQSELRPLSYTSRTNVRSHMRKFWNMSNIV